MKKKNKKNIEKEADSVSKPVGEYALKDAMAPADMSEEEEERKAKYDLDDLLRAEDIKSDSKRMEKVRKHAEKHMFKVKSIADLKDVYDAKFGAKK